MTRQVQSPTLIRIRNSKTSNSRRTYDKRRETRMAVITPRKAATPSIQASEAQETDPRVHLTDLQVLWTDQERAS